jgi:hypothetical protein
VDKVDALRNVVLKSLNGDIHQGLLLFSNAGKRVGCLLSTARLYIICQLLPHP